MQVFLLSGRQCYTVVAPVCFFPIDSWEVILNIIPTNICREWALYYKSLPEAFTFPSSEGQSFQCCVWTCTEMFGINKTKKELIYFLNCGGKERNLQRRISLSSIILVYINNFPSRPSLILLWTITVFVSQILLHVTFDQSFKISS